MIHRALEGGWGQDLVYHFGSDEDEDYIHDQWESLGGYGTNLTFSVTEPGDEASELDVKKRSAWEHGWDSLEEATAGQEAGNYTNPNGYQPSTGRGLTRFNEDAVFENKTEIEALDWSHTQE